VKELSVKLGPRTRDPCTILVSACTVSHVCHSDS
jgi:hypothetical protein